MRETDSLDPQDTRPAAPMHTTDASKAVFERSETVASWDDDYYHPIAVQFYDAAIPMMLKLMNAPQSATVLDAGCGPGVHSIRAAQAGYRLKSIDISLEMLRHAKERAVRAGVADRIEFQHDDLTRLSLADASFQYVFSWGVIIHIHEINKALDELVRVIAPGGMLALYVTNDAAIDQKGERLMRWLLRKPATGRQRLKLGTGTWYNMHGERLWVWQFDIPELEHELAKRGMRLRFRMAGELSEIQRRVPRALRILFLHLNNWYYRLRMPAAAAIGNLLIFERIK